MSVSFSDSSSSPTPEQSVPPSVPASGTSSPQPPVAEKRALPIVRIVVGVLGLLLLLSVVQLWALVVALASLGALMYLVYLAVLIREQHWITRFWAWWDARRSA